MREKTIENAKITGTKISMEDHGCLTFDLVIEGSGWGCCVGGYAIGHGYLNSDYWDATGAGLVAMMKIMNTVGVSRWEDLKGKYIRVESEGWGGTITKIGHLINDEWFDLRDFFKTVDHGTPCVLDEREEKDEDV